MIQMMKALSSLDFLRIGSFCGNDLQPPDI